MESPNGVRPAGPIRVPYWDSQDPELAHSEQGRVFEGPTWQHLCLEIDVADIGECRTAFMGGMQAAIVRVEDGDVPAFESRCVQRGVASAGGVLSVIEMGGATPDTADTRATEASDRGVMGL